MTNPPQVPRVVQYLRTGGTLDELTQRYAISVVRSVRSPSLVLLKYDMIDSPMAEPIVQESRGIVLDESRNFQVVSRSFDKFFNHGEGHGRPIDWKTARVMEKLDGSLMVLFHHEGDWRVQSSGTPDAMGTTGDERVVLSDLFWETFRSQGYALPPVGSESLCFAFELMSQHNQVVVRHAAARLCLIGARDRVTQIERHVEDCTQYGYEIVRSFALRSIADINQTFLSMKPMGQEGYVVIDAYFNRAKVKHPGYVALHHMKAEFTIKRLVEVVRSGETSELATYFPEWRSDIERVGELYEQLLIELQADFERLRHHVVQKDFALEANKTRFPGALFGMRTGKIQSLRRYMADLNIETLMKALGLRDEPATKV